MIKVALKYCGHCNPNMDMDVILNNVKKSTPNVSYVTLENDYDIAFLVNGCNKKCIATNEQSSILITPNSVNGQKVKRAQVEKAVLKALEQTIKEGRC